MSSLNITGIKVVYLDVGLGRNVESLLMRVVPSQVEGERGRVYLKAEFLGFQIRVSQ